MVSIENQSGLSEDGAHCGSCQHSVNVRGNEQVVCLAFLDMRHPTKVSVCSEFIGKKGKVIASLSE